MLESCLHQKDLIEYATKYLKAKGFKKERKRWKKTTEEFTLVFFIQGSSYTNECYYVRPGIFINRYIDSVPSYYGHFYIEINAISPEETLEAFDRFCDEWTNKELIKKRLIDFIAWDQRNPLEKRYAELAERLKNPNKREDPDPCPAKEILDLSFHSGKDMFNYILENY